MSTHGTEENFSFNLKEMTRKINFILPAGELHILPKNCAWDKFI